MYKILKGLSRCRARAPAAPTQSSKTEDGEIQDDGINTFAKTNYYDERLEHRGTCNESTDWQNHYRFNYEKDVHFRYKYCGELVLGSATIWAFARILNDVHKRERPKSSYCIWKILKDKCIKERLGELCSSLTTLPQLTVNSVLPRVPSITLASRVVHAAGEEGSSTARSVLGINVSGKALCHQVQVLQTKKKKTVTIDPKFVSNDDHIPSLTSKSDSSVSTTDSFSEEDIDEFVSSTKHCIGLTHNIQGLEFYKEEKYEQAVQSFEFGSKEGCSQAQYNLALCFERGKGVDKNMEKAKSEYRKAAAQGHKWAQYNLALMLFLEDETVATAHGMFLLEKAAKQGMVEAQSLLGAKLAHKGPHHNMKKAVKMFTLASAQEDVVSIYHLAECHEHGLGGLTSSGSHAYELYADAARRGHLDAKYKMAAILLNGCNGVNKNEELAKKLFEEAASKGHVAAKQRCEELKRNRNEVSFKIGTVLREDDEVDTEQLFHLFMPEILRNLQVDFINEHLRAAPTMKRSKLFGPALLETSLPHGLNFHRASTWPNALAQFK